MWGYGARHDTLSVGTLDPLQAAALVIQAGDKKLAIVGLDLAVRLRRSRFRTSASASSRCGIEYSFIAGSHSHHTPVLELSDEPGRARAASMPRLRYYKRLEDAIVAAIVEADPKLTPAEWPPARWSWKASTATATQSLRPKPRIAI